jgi:NAD(P)-dependent dehydrogenase (short-subunit alcohol dehydrogenase family)
MTIPSFSIEGKVAIVTGASRGIGKTLALGFAEAGAKVALVARTVSELEKTADEIRSKGGTAIVVPTDVTERQQLELMVRKTKEEFGRIDVLLNVAGGAGDVYVLPPLDMQEEHYDELHGRNCRAVFFCNQAVARVMVEQKSGSIINVSSLSGTKPIAYEAVVGGFKAAVNQMTKALAIAWGPDNVRVNAIAPGITLTERVKKKLGPEFIENLSEGIPLRRPAQSEDHLGPAIFLASDASAYITGMVIPSDGGPQ